MHKVKKQWFWVSFAYFLLTPLLLLNFVRIQGVEKPVFLQWVAFWIAINLLVFFVLYLCSYRKIGTKLLGFYMFFTFMRVFDIFLQLTGISMAGKEICFLGLTFEMTVDEKFNSYPVSYLTQGHWDISQWICAMSYLVLAILFYYFSRRLRKANKQLRASNIPKAT